MTQKKKVGIFLFKAFFFLFLGQIFEAFSPVVRSSSKLAELRESHFIVAREGSNSFYPSLCDPFVGIHFLRLYFPLPLALFLNLRFPPSTATSGCGYASIFEFDSPFSFCFISSFFCHSRRSLNSVWLS